MVNQKNDAYGSRFWDAGKINILPHGNSKRISCARGFTHGLKAVVSPKNPRHKKGVIRIIEATIAIVIVLTALIILNYRNVPQTEQDLTSITQPVLDSMAHNITMRQEIINYDTSKSSSDSGNEEIIQSLMNYIDSRVENNYLDYRVEICEAGSVCSLDPYPADIQGNVYADEEIISTTITAKTFNPKKVKIFIWRKATQ